MGDGKGVKIEQQGTSVGKMYMRYNMHIPPEFSYVLGCCWIAQNAAGNTAMC